MHAGSYRLRIGLVGENEPRVDVLHAVVREEDRAAADVPRGEPMETDGDANVAAEAMAVDTAPGGAEGGGDAGEEAAVADEEGADDGDAAETVPAAVLAKVKRAVETRRRQVDRVLKRHQLKPDVPPEATWTTRGERQQAARVRRGVFPLRGGRFNPAHSDQLVTDVLERLWQRELARVVDLGAAASMRVVLVVPDAATKHEVRTMMRILARLAFRQILVQRDSVAVAFATALPTTCVVNFGRTRTQVSVLEDGMLVPATVRRLDYGALDVARVLHRLLCASRTIAFPVHAVDWDDVGQAESLEALASRVANLVLDLDPFKEAEFALDGQTHAGIVGPEAHLAPMGLFFPALFGTRAAVRPRVVRPYDAEDAFDADFMEQSTPIATIRNRETKSRKEEKKDAAAAAADDDDAGDESSEDKDEDAVDAVDGIDEAVLSAIGERTSVSTVVLAGGLGEMDGLADMLAARLNLPVTVAIGRSAWAGGCIFAQLDACEEANWWIDAKDVLGNVARVKYGVGFAW